MRHPLMACVLCLSVLPAIAAHAATKPSSTGIVLDREGLRKCVELEGRIDASTRRYNAEVQAFNANVKRSNTLGAELNAMRKAVDAGDAAALDAYNAKVEEHNAMGREYNDGQLRLAQLSEDSDAVKSEFNARCAHRRFRDADLVEIKGKPKARTKK